MTTTQNETSSPYPDSPFGSWESYLEICPKDIPPYKAISQVVWDRVPSPDDPGSSLRARIERRSLPFWEIVVPVSPGLRHVVQFALTFQEHPEGGGKAFLFVRNSQLAWLEYAPVPKDALLSQVYGLQVKLRESQESQSFYHRRTRDLEGELKVCKETLREIEDREYAESWTERWDWP